MARYCVAFESMKCFLSLKGQECLADMVGFGTSSGLWICHNNKFDFR